MPPLMKLVPNFLKIEYLVRKLGRGAHNHYINIIAISLAYLFLEGIRTGWKWFRNFLLAESL
jgi:hypothetical protein